MPAVSLSGVYSAQFFTDAGDLAANYRLYTYSPGTTTKKVAYTEQTGTTSHTYVADGSGGEYIALNARGELPAPLFLTSGGYDLTLKTATGTSVWTRRAYATTVDTDSALAASTGSALVGHVQSGTGAETTTVQAKLRQVINAADYGAGPAASASANVTAITEAITYCKTLDAPELVIPAGRLSVDDTLTFDLPNGSTVRFIGVIVSSVANASAVVIGSDAGNKYYYNVTGLKVERTATDYSGTSIGVELVNLAWATVDIRQCSGFRYGVVPHGNGAGCTYNNVHLGMLHDNRVNLRLIVTDAAGGGYCNENNFFGGSLNHSSGYDVATYAAINLEITHDGTSAINNNRFWGLSLEDAHASSDNTTAAIINGEFNVLYHPRLERITSHSTYKVQFTANSSHCGIVGNGYALNNANVDDAGSATCFETSEGVSIRKSTPNTSGKGVLRLRSTNTSAARVLLIEDSGGTEVMTIRGGGEVYTASPNKFFFVANGSDYADDAAAAAGGIAVGQMYRTGSALKVRVA